jgi:hypothetical protein
MPKTKEFNKLLKNIRDNYLGKVVPKKYQHKYGKKYDKDDVLKLTYAIASAKGIRID